MYFTRASVLCSRLIKVEVLKTPTLARIWQASLSFEGSSSRDLGFVCLTSFTQYKGKPSRAEGSKLEQQTLKNFPFHPLKDCWNKVRRTLPDMPLRLTQRLFPCFFTSNKWRKMSMEGACPKNPHKISNALTKAQPLGCSWAGATLISVRSPLSNLEKGRHIPTHLKTT